MVNVQWCILISFFPALFVASPSYFRIPRVKYLPNNIENENTTTCVRHLTYRDILTLAQIWLTVTLFTMPIIPYSHNDTKN